MAMSSIVQYNDWLEEEVSRGKGAHCHHWRKPGHHILNQTVLLFRHVILSGSGSSPFRKVGRTGVLFNYE